MIFLYCDSHWRDSLGLAILASKLQKSSVDTAVIPFDIWADINKLLKPDDIIIINHGAGKRNNDIATEAKKKGAHVFAIHTEGRPNTKEDLQWYKQQDGGCLQKIFVWSDIIAELYSNTDVVISGSPRFDVYRSEYKRFITPGRIIKGTHGISSPGKVILVASGHAQAKFRTSAQAWNRKDREDLNAPYNPDEEALNDYYSRELFLNWIVYLNNWARTQRHHLVVKPHPMETSLFWEQEGERHGFNVVTQEYAHNLISMADILVNRGGCTTTLEANLLNKPVISIEKPKREGLALDTFQIATHATGPESLVRKCKTLLEENTQKQSELIDKLGIRTKEASSDVILSALLKMTNVPANGRLFKAQEILVQKLAQHSIPYPGFSPGKITTPYKLNEVFSII